MIKILECWLHHYVTNLSELKYNFEFLCQIFGFFLKGGEYSRCGRMGLQCGRISSLKADWLSHPASVCPLLLSAGSTSPNFSVFNGLLSRLEKNKNVHYPYPVSQTAAIKCWLMDVFSRFGNPLSFQEYPHCKTEYMRSFVWEGWVEQ